MFMSIIMSIQCLYNVLDYFRKYMYSNYMVCNIFLSKIIWRWRLLRSLDRFSHGIYIKIYEMKLIFHNNGIIKLKNKIPL